MCMSVDTSLPDYYMYIRYNQSSGDILYDGKV